MAVDVNKALERFEKKANYSRAELEEILTATLEAVEKAHLSIVGETVNEVAQKVIETTCSHVVTNSDAKLNRAKSAFIAVTQGKAKCTYSLQHLQGQIYAYGDVLDEVKLMSKVIDNELKGVE